MWGHLLCYVLIVILDSRITAPVSMIYILSISYIAVLSFLDVYIRIIFDCKLRTFCRTYPRVEDNLLLQGGF